MVALTVVVLAMIAFGIVGAYLGYDKGYDDGFEAALECYEEEIRNAHIQSNN